jgi:hypothetical protein
VRMETKTAVMLLSLWHEKWLRQVPGGEPAGQFEGREVGYDLQDMRLRQENPCSHRVPSRVVDHEGTMARTTPPFAQPILAASLVLLAFSLLVLYAMNTRYEYHMTGGIIGQRVDRWTGRVQVRMCREVLAPGPKPSLKERLGMRWREWREPEKRVRRERIEREWKELPGSAAFSARWEWLREQLRQVREPSGASVLTKRECWWK